MSFRWRLYRAAKRPLSLAEKYGFHRAHVVVFRITDSSRISEISHVPESSRRCGLFERQNAFGDKGFQRRSSGICFFQEFTLSHCRLLFGQDRNASRMASCLANLLTEEKERSADWFSAMASCTMTSVFGVYFSWSVCLNVDDFLL